MKNRKFIGYQEDFINSKKSISNIDFRNLTSTDVDDFFLI